ncbi:MAG: DNA-directed RNA polymerase subunit beta [Selenomonadaceae bacterium]|nr:DNA-directed RNA polymerase subunit beta [Selenomonadaceae bacterium]MBQ9496259.1 DNA-directed RNA polymerase subunit beta [Selenomonadaceae bacterium]
MFNPVQVGKGTRYSYARIKEVMEMPHLLDIQRNSYDWFKKEGLQEIFRDISPIADFSGNLELFFGEPTFGECKYTLEECKKRDGTYAAPVRVKVRLHNKIKGDVKVQEVFMGDFPIMTTTGTFIINGAERVIVSQLVRSPGAYYDKSIDQTGKNIYNATVIPNRGAWIELETDSAGAISVRIDRTRKMPVTYFLRALDYQTNESILELFDVKFFILSKLHDETTATQLISFLTAEAENGIDARNSFTVGYLRRGGERNEETFDRLLNAYHELDEKNDLLSNYKYLLDKLAELDDKNALTAGYKALVDLLDTDHRNGEDNKEKALIGIYNRLRPGEPPSADNAASLLHSQFFDPRRYDLAAVGRYKITKKLGWKRRILGRVLAEDLFSMETGELLLPAGEVITQAMLDEIPDDREVENFIGWENLFLGEAVTEDVRDPETGELVFPAGEVITQATLEKIPEERREEIFKAAANKLRRGFKCPIKIRIKTDSGAYTMLCAPTLSIRDNRTVCVADIMSSINYVFALMSDSGIADDIDHLGNRRVRSVGELLQNQFRIGMARMERVVRERMTTQDAEIVTPQNLINIRPVVAAIKEFFGSSQLSQFMDQHNPLSELTHKRRLSALGPGGLSRERAGFEVRDVHNSHYGRMCPIETPEGPNIGLIGSLSNYARVNQYGFMETPYRLVDKENHRVTNEVRYMTADEEEALIIAQANEPLDENDWFVNERVTARVKEETTKVRRERVDCMDVSPKQVVSIATAMIPFLENDDANRALMGANMQRQAVPLLKTQAPLVGTGMEFKAACDSGVMVLARRPGTVVQVDAETIKVRVDDKFVNSVKDKFDVYKLQKFVRSNQGTCINQIPIVEEGEHIEARQPIADGPATSQGELALGYNIIVAYMPWEGYNYEDAILLSENLIKRDIYTSIHIEEYQCDARDTKLGPEEVTRDIPNVAEDSLVHLDSEGIIAIGADVRTGDILVGKVTPKGETELTAEERLLRAIFGEKAREVRDTSLRVPHGESGKVVAVNVFTRENNDEMAPGVNKQVRVYIAQKRKISVGDKMSGRHGNKGVVSEIRRQEDMPFLPDGTPVDIVLNPLGVPSRMNIGQVLETHLGMAVRQIGMRIKSRDKNIVRDLKAFGFDVDRYGLPKPSAAGVNIATPVFDGARDEDIANTIKLAGLDEDGKTILYDGRTGEPFENRVTVGCVYMLKLHHLVDDKIHARSTGPYSLVTQQPLGGKAQFGGQRFGEMEVWALEAYGASYTLQEILTVKSDDVVGRVKAYEAIVKGQNIPEPGVPESFKVLIKELQSIGLDIRVLSGDSKEIIIHDDEDEDDRAVRKKADDMGVDVGNYGDHEVKAPEPEEPPEDIIAEDVSSDKDLTAEEIIAVEEFSADKDLTDEELDAQLKTLSDLAKADRSEEV